MRGGLLIGGLIALAIAVAPVYDDYRSHMNAVEYLGIQTSWFPDPLFTLGPVVLALAALALIARAVAKRSHVWPLAVGFGAIGAIVIAWQTRDVARYPGDATAFRMYVLPAMLVAALSAGLVLARKRADR